MDAGDRIWICRVHPGEHGVRVESVNALSELPGGFRQRRAALKSLISKVESSPRSAWGFDFAFGIPQAMLCDADREASAPLQLDSFSAAECWAARLRALEVLGKPRGAAAAWVTAADDSHRCRHTESERGLEKPLNELSECQASYYGIVNLLEPLRRRDFVAILPMDLSPWRIPRVAPTTIGGEPHVYLLEVRPALVLRVLDRNLPDDAFLGSDSATFDLRRRLMRRLVEVELVRPIDRRSRHRLLEAADGQAFGSLLCAVAAWRGYRNYDHAELAGERPYAIEGFIYG